MTLSIEPAVGVLAPARSYASVLGFKASPILPSPPPSPVAAAADALPLSILALPLSRAASTASTSSDSCSNAASDAVTLDDDLALLSDAEVEVVEEAEFLLLADADVFAEEDEPWTEDEYEDESAEVLSLTERCMAGLHSTMQQHQRAQRCSAEKRPRHAHSAVMRALQAQPAALAAASRKRAPRRRDTFRSAGSAASAAATAGSAADCSAVTAQSSNPTASQSRPMSKAQALAAIAASVATSSRRGASAQPAVAQQQPAAAQRKGAARAAAAAARRLPVQLLECKSPRWRAVLEQRAAAKQASAELRALGPRHCAVLPKARVAKKGHRVGVQPESTAPSRAERRVAKLQLQHHVKEQRARSLPAAPVHSLLPASAAARWAAAHPEPKPTASKPPASARRQRAAPRPVVLHLRPVVPPRAPRAAARAESLGKSSNCSHAFNAFRAAWLAAHRDRILRSLNGIRALHLAEPAPTVQAAFLYAASRLSCGRPSAAFAAFHGTALRNVESILAHGFLVAGGTHPETGRRIPVANGSAYGNGVYISLTANYSLAYARGHDSMFVCAVLDAGALSRHDNILVARNPHLVVPMLVMDFDRNKAYAQYGGGGASVAAVMPVVKRPRKVCNKQLKADQRRQEKRQMQLPALMLLRALLRQVHARERSNARLLSC